MLNKKFIMKLSLVLLGLTPKAYADFCARVGAVSSTTQCVTVYSACGGGKLSSGNSCVTNNYQCVSTANASLKFPFSTVGEWEHSSTTYDYFPNSDSECPIE
jgi:hypothetical protein